MGSTSTDVTKWEFRGTLGWEGFRGSPVERGRCAPLRRGGDSSEVPNSCEPKRGVWPALHLEMGIGEEWAKAKLVLQLRCDNCLMIIDNKIAVLRCFFFFAEP